MNNIERYKSLLKTYQDDAELARDIEKIKDPIFRDRLIDAGKDFYAEKHGCDKSEVFFGDINFSKQFWNGLIVFPYKVVVGSLRARMCDISAPDLEVVYGDLDLTAADANILSLKYAKKLVATGANIKYFNKSMKVDELVCNKNCIHKGFHDCFKDQIEIQKDKSIDK